jgi:GAF domain-containing protein
MSPTPNSKLADPQQTIAELSRQLAERTAERDEALAREIATAEVLQVINSSPGDLKPVFDAMLEKAMQLCGVDNGSLQVYDGQLFRGVAGRGLPEPLAEFIRQGWRPGPMSPLRPILDGARFVHVPDLTQVDPSEAGLAVENGSRTLLSVPLRKDGVLLGQIVAVRQEVRPFGDKEVRLLENFAAQAVIAMGNARLIAETREALEQQTATAEVLGIINSSPGDLAPVFDAMLEKATRFCEADGGTLWTFDGERFFPAVVFNNPAVDAMRGGIRPSPSVSLGRLIGGEDIVHVLDVAADPGYQADVDALARTRAAGSRTVLAVSLRKDDRLLGAITTGRRAVRAYSEKQIALLQNFAAQAVIAMENARLITETREALEQQTATAEVLQVINSSPGDLGPVFEAMLEKAMRLCDASFGELYNWDGERLNAAALRGIPEALAAFRISNPTTTNPGTITGRIIHGESVVHVLDLMAEDAYQSGDPQRRALVDLGGARTALAVALHNDRGLLGLIMIYRQDVRAYTEQQIALLQNFAAQAVIAMENARLITETREALEQQTATSEILQVINSSPGDLAPVFDAMLDKAMRLCGFDHGALQTHDGQVFRAVAVRGASSPFGDLMRQPFKPDLHGEGPLLQRLMNGAPYVQFADMAELLAQGHNDIRTRGAVELGGFRTALFVPLRTEGALLGYISALRKEVRPFTDKQIALLQNFAAQAVIAMENARLITETREALDQQTATAEVLGVINSSPGDLGPVFEAILEKAHRICSLTRGSLVTYDGSNFNNVARRGVGEQVAAVMSQAKSVPWTAQKALLRGDRLVHIPDLSAYSWDPDDTVMRPYIEATGLRAGLLVPLRKDGALLGYISGYRDAAGPFSEKQIELLQNFAVQAVIAMENARLITETREALAQQTATAEVLQVINSSPGDLAPVFDAMLDKAMQLCEAEFGILNTYDGENFHRAAARGVPPAFEEWRRRQGPRLSGPLWDRFVRGETVIAMRDVVEDEVHRIGPGLQAIVRFGGARSYVAIALRKDDRLLGVISIYRQEVRPFSEKQIALLQNFAAQAVIAMENARLITETREALEQQTATAEVLGVINSSPGDLAPVFDAMLERALRLCGAAFGMLGTVDGDELRTVAARGLPRAYVEFRKNNPAVHGPGRARILAGERVVHILDLSNEEFYRTSEPNRRAVVDLGGARTVLLVALEKDGGVLGHIGVYRQEVKPFTEKQIALLQNFAAQAVIAMENARLITETREALEQQTATAEVLQVINSSPGNLGPVFEAMLDKAHMLCGAEHGSLGTYDGDYFRAVVSRGYPAAVLERLKGGFHGLENPVTRPLFDGARFVQFPDLGEIDHPIPKAVAALGGFRTALFVPLRKDGKLLGHISASRLEVRPFAEKEIALLENFAAQAVIAMENARLLGELRQRTEEVADLNRGLEARVAEQVDELGRVGRLKRFLAPQLAEMIVSQGDEKMLESHRREIVVVFCDLRDYTAFTETAEPEEVLDFLREYHGALGPLVSQFEGTLDQFSGDGIMVFFNDPVPVPDPAERAVKMAIAMRQAAGKLIANWRRHGGELGFGVGIAQGFATLGQIGFADRSGYTAIGTVCNLAARLCAEAKDGQILISSRVADSVEAVAQLEHLGNLDLKGLRRPVAAFNVGEQSP